MPSMKAVCDDRHCRADFAVGANVRQLLETTDCRVHAGCSGNGACGLCRIRLQGGANAPSLAEQLYFGEGGLAQGMRLACQAIPSGDVFVEVLNPAPENGFRGLADEDYYPVRTVTKPAHTPPALGVAVDLGTTNVTVTLWDLAAGRRLAGRRGANRQFRHGADVLTRVMAAAASDEAAREISQLAVATVGDALSDMLLREGRCPGDVRHVVLAGNTAQLALLALRNFHCLLDPASWGRPLDCAPEQVGDWLVAWNLPPETRVDVLAPLAGFVGSDLLAGVLATKMRTSGEPALLIDFGTNSEMALWDRQRLWVTSAAGGPAFEGCGLSCGMPATSGAVCNAELDEGGTWRIKTVADAPPRGVCGSGLVDMVACLLNAGVLDETGRFKSGTDGKGHCMHAGGTEFALTKRDVDVFQRAKAAIATGVQVLCNESSCASRSIKKLFVCGAFGKYLNVAGAQRAGLLPRLVEGQTLLCGNTSLAGCELLLNDQASLEQFSALQRDATLINMCEFDLFEEYFMRNLFLKPCQ